jgi:hypothetical protein
MVLLCAEKKGKQTGYPLLLERTNDEPFLALFPENRKNRLCSVPSLQEGDDGRKGSGQSVFKREKASPRDAVVSNQPYRVSKRKTMYDPEKEG